MISASLQKPMVGAGIDLRLEAPMTFTFWSFMNSVQFYYFIIASRDKVGKNPRYSGGRRAQMVVVSSLRINPVRLVGWVLIARRAMANGSPLAGRLDAKQFDFTVSLAALNAARSIDSDYCHLL